MRNIHYLKFVVGAFCVIGGFLLLNKISDDYSEWNLNKTIGWGGNDHCSIKRWVGSILIIFGIIMMLFAFRKRSGDKPGINP